MLHGIEILRALGPGAPVPGTADKNFVTGGAPMGPEAFSASGRGAPLRRAAATIARCAGTAAVLAAVVLACASVQIVGSARAAQPYPSRPIKVVVGFAAGGPADIIARLVSAKLDTILGQQVYVENRPGASGNIATEYVAHAEPDGYTLMIATPSTAVNESLFENFPYRMAKDFTPIAPLAGTGLVLVAHPSLHVASVAQLVALAKSKPGQILYATAGKGTSTHLAAEMFDFAAGIEMTPVHYKGGGETVKDLLSGEIKLMFSSIPPVLGFVRQGKLRGLATTGLKRDLSLPDLPTVAESGFPRFNVWLWTGLLAPAHAPPAVVDRLAAATEQALKSDSLKAALAAQGNVPMYGTPEQFGAYYRDEAEKYAKLIPIIGTIGD
jgi:tripartite-type tricarboxylate transporter receptor subunit TctC